MIMHMRNLFMIRQDSQAVLSFISESMVNKIATPNEKLASKFRPGGSIFELVGGVTDALLLSVFPYPFNFIYFMGMRPDVAAVLYVVLPGVFTLFCIPVALSIKNYFGSNKYGVVKHREVYRDLPLSEFMCGGEETNEGEYEEGEEDLASTFAGSSEEEDSLLGSSNESSR